MTYGGGQKASENKVSADVTRCSLRDYGIFFKPRHILRIMRLMMIKTQPTMSFFSFSRFHPKIDHHVVGGAAATLTRV